MHNTERRRKFFKSLEAKSLRSRSFLTQVADLLTAMSGSPVFLLINTAFFVGWIVCNTGIIPGFPVFDPYPFGMLTMVVSLEAIFLSIFVLISQNRSAYISTIREEVHLQVNLTAEQEITKILKVLSEMRTKMGISETDHELEHMIQNINESQIEQNIAAQIGRANKNILFQLKSEFPEFIHDVIKMPGEIFNPNKGNERGMHELQREQHTQLKLNTEPSKPSK